MYLSNRDIKWRIQTGRLLVDPPPEAWGAGYDETTIDLRLGPVSNALVWDVERFMRDQRRHGVTAPELHLGQFNWGEFSEQYLIPPPAEAPSASGEPAQPVCLRGTHVLVRPGGFLLWKTKEWVGTPKENPDLIAFVNAKSTRARTGIIVHFTAPTINSGWSGQLFLEIANHGPFHFVLKEDDVIAQLIVATISSAPDLSLKVGESQTQEPRPREAGRRRRRAR